MRKKSAQQILQILPRNKYYFIFDMLNINIQINMSKIVLVLRLNWIQYKEKKVQKYLGPPGSRLGVGSRLEPRPTATTLSRKRSSSKDIWCSNDRERRLFFVICYKMFYKRSLSNIIWKEFETIIKQIYLVWSACAWPEFYTCK